DGQQVLHGIRTAKPAETRVSRGRGHDGEKVENSAAEFADDEWQFGDQIAQFAGRWDDSELLRIEHADLRLERLIDRANELFRRTEHAREGAVNGVGRAIGIRMDAHAEVGSVGPLLTAQRI